MSRRRKAHASKRRRREFYIALQFWELECPAFAHLSADATRVYLFMRKRLNFDCSNNGAVPFSHRDAREALHAGGWRRGSNALAELEHFGFVKLRNRGVPGKNIRLACEWQLTAFGCGGQGASKHFMRWHGEAFQPPYQSTATRPQEQVAIGNLKTPHRQHEDAYPDSAIPKPSENGVTGGNVKTLQLGRRRQHEATSTD